MLDIVKKLPFSFKKKPEISLAATLRDEQINHLHRELDSSARLIISIQSQLNDIGAKESAYIQGWQDLLYAKLHAEERIFFVLYNQLRAMYGISALQGDRFTGEYNYSIHLRR